MIEKVLITGASGFIGYHLVQAALQNGYEVHAAVRPSSNIESLKSLVSEYEGIVSQNLKFVNLNYASKDSLIQELRNGAYEYIVHAAGATRAKDATAYNRINAEYSLNLAEASICTDLPLKRFLFMSSLAAIGPLKYDAMQPITESSDPNPVTSYGKSKLLAEKYLLGIKGLPLTIIRPTAVYGPRERDILIVFKTLMKGLDLYIGENPQRLSFVYVDDLVRATLAALTSAKAEKISYNISDGNQYERYELAKLFRDWSDKKTFRLHIPLFLIKGIGAILEKGSIFSANTPVLNREKIHELTAENWYCSIDSARTDLNYIPRYDLRRGLHETLNWYRSNRWL